MMMTSLLLTLLGFYWLVNSHVDQAVRISKVKNLQIVANTLAELTRNRLGVIGSETWMIANMISSYYKNPNLQFQQELEYQATQLPQKV